MKKLGYTWYPNDWRTDEKVFNMSLELRGFYREFIDFAYQNDNNFAKNQKYWCRMLGINKRKFDTLFDLLLSVDLIMEKDGKYYIPSVEPRIQLIRGGRKGGKISKGPLMPIGKPDSKPDNKQRETERETETESKGNTLIPTYDVFKEYAIAKNLNTDFTRLRFKYQSWVENDWKDGNDRPIKNWNSLLLNTLPHLNSKSNNKKIQL